MYVIITMKIIRIIVLKTHILVEINIRASKMVQTSRGRGNLKKWQRGKVNDLLNIKKIIVSTSKVIHDYGGIITT